MPLFGVQLYKSAAHCCTIRRQSARSRKSLTENSSICIIRSRILYVFTCLNVAGRLPMFLLIFVVFLLPPSHTHPRTTSYFNPLTPTPPIHEVLSKSYFIQKRRDMWTVWNEYKKTGLGIYGVEQFNRLLYAVHPCNSNIRQGRETTHPHSPPSQRHSKSLRRLLHSAVSGGRSELRADAGF